MKHWIFETSVEFVLQEQLLDVGDVIILPHENREYTVVFSNDKTYIAKHINNNWIPIWIKLKYYVILYKIKDKFNKL